MLLLLSELLGYTIRTYEKDVGIVEDILFSDETWRIKYAVVRITSGYEMAQVIVPLDSPACYVIQDRVLKFHGTIAKLRALPTLDDIPPVTRQEELRLHRDNPVMGLYPYASDWGFAPVPLFEEATTAKSINDIGSNSENASGQVCDPHLRSYCELTGYRIQTLDGRGGTLADLECDLEQNSITRLIIKERRRLFGKKTLLVPVTLVHGICWATEIISVQLTRKALLTIGENANDF